MLSHLEEPKLCLSLFPPPEAAPFRPYRPLPVYLLSASPDCVPMKPSTKASSIFSEREHIICRLEDGVFLDEYKSTSFFRPSPTADYGLRSTKLSPKWMNPPRDYTNSCFFPRASHPRLKTEEGTQESCPINRLVFRSEFADLGRRLS